MESSETINLPSMSKNLILNNQTKSGFIVKDLQDLITITNILVASGSIPSWHIAESNGDNKKVCASVMACILKGMEIGLPLMASIQFIARVDGNLTVWGDGARAIIIQHPQFEDIKESYDSVNKIATCTLKRRNVTAATETFSFENAEQAGLTTKKSYMKYPELMLKRRAFAKAAHVVFPDSFIGYITEEFCEMKNVTMDIENHTIVENKSIEHHVNNDMINTNQPIKQEESINVSNG